MLAATQPQAGTGQDVHETLPIQPVLTRQHDPAHGTCVQWAAQSREGCREVRRIDATEVQIAAHEPTVPSESPTLRKVRALCRRAWLRWPKLHRLATVGEADGQPNGKRAEMTDTAETALTQALELVDRGLSELQSREIVSAGQVADMLLDLRLLLLDLDEGSADPVEAALAT